MIGRAKAELERAIARAAEISEGGVDTCDYQAAMTAVDTAQRDLYAAEQAARGHRDPMELLYIAQQRRKFGGK